MTFGEILPGEASQKLRLPGLQIDPGNFCPGLNFLERELAIWQRGPDLVEVIQEKLRIDGRHVRLVFIVLVIPPKLLKPGQRRSL